MSLSHSELCHHRKCALISLIALMMAASSEKHPTKIHNQPPLEAPGCRRLRVYAKMWKEEPWCQRFSVWWSKKIKQTKGLSWFKGAACSGPRRSGTEEPCRDPNQENPKEKRHSAARGLKLQPAHSFFSPSAAPKQCAKSVLEHLHKRNVEIRLLPWVKYSRTRRERSEELADSKSSVGLIIVQQWKFCFKCSSWQIPFHRHLTMK